MDKIITLGPFGFTGFYMCSNLLEKGIEIWGIPFSNCITECNSDEKYMEIGRNANFVILDNLTSLDHGESLVFDAMIIPYYDLYMSGKEFLLTKSTFVEKLSPLIQKTKQLVFLLPLQFASKDYEELRNWNSVQELLLKHASDTIQVRSFYLPTLYGPWQPRDFKFEEIMMESDNGHEKRKFRESTVDALYVEDGIEAICKNLELNTPERILLQSNISGHWGKCMEVLGASGSNLSSDIIIDDQIAIVTVDSSYSIEEGLQRQKDHNQRFLREKK